MDSPPAATAQAGAGDGQIAAPPLPEAPEVASAPKVPEASPVAPRRTYKFHEMRLKVGDRLQLEPPSQTGETRLPVNVVGWDEERTLISTLPRSKGGRLSLREGEAVVMRAFTGRSAFAFRCSVLHNSAPPSDYLFLSIPGEVEGVDVRASPRYRVGLAATVTPAGGAGTVAAHIDNIGTTGALIVAPEPIGETDQKIGVDFDFELHGIPTSLKLKARICSASSSEDPPGKVLHRCGVAFVDPTPNELMILSALVWFHMYENPKLLT